MGRELIDLYSDYLLYSNGQTTATGLSNQLGGEISHDKITRFLSTETFDEKALWKKVKKAVRRYEQEDACIVFDDTVIEKPYMDENEIVSWYYDHKSKGTVKGINLLTAFYVTEKDGERLRLPIDFRVIAKTEAYTDEKTGEEKKKSRQTKNEMMREMLGRHIRNQVKFRYILADTWYSSVENMKNIKKKEKVFIFELKDNRKIAKDEARRNSGAFERLDQMEMSEKAPVQVWIKDLEFPVLVYKQVFINKDGTRGVRYLASNDLSLTKDRFETLYKKRWGVEEYHKSLKQNASIGSSPAYRVASQKNHIFAAIVGYVKLEMLRIAVKLNHFALKTKIYMASMKTAMLTFQKLWTCTQNLAFA